MNKRTVAGLLVGVLGALSGGGCVNALPAAPDADGGAPGDATVGADASPGDATATEDAAGDAPAAPASGFDLTVAPTSTSIVRGGSAQLTITVAPGAGFAGPVTVTVSGLPNGVTASSLILPSGETSGALTLQATATATLTVGAKVSISGASPGTPTPPGAALSLMVQDPPGTLDVTFGVNGVAVVLVEALNPTGSLGAIALQPDGKIVYCGNAPYEGSYDLLLGRLNVDGSPDATFNPTGSAPGIVTLLPAGARSFVCSDAAILPSGDIALSGFMNENGQNHNMFAAEFTSAGALEPGFGGGAGYVPIWTDDVDSKPYSLLVQSNGDLVLAGYVSPTPSITRLLPTGAPDTTFAPITSDAGFGFDSFTAYPGAFQAIAPLPNGDWLAAINDEAIALSPTTGRVDTSFGPNSGVLSVASFAVPATSLVVEADGSSALVGTTTSTPTTLALAHFNAVGQADTAFGSQGVASPAIAGGATANSLTASADGKLIVGGTFGSTSAVGVARYTAKGALDPGFANGAGYASVPQADGSVVQSAAFVGLDPAGRIVVAYLLEVSANTYDAGTYGNPAVQVARFWP